MLPGDAIGEGSEIYGELCGNPPRPAMQPLAHGEDPKERLYITRSLAEVEADPEAYKDKCLRVDLKPGEVLDAELTVRRPEEELSDEHVALGDFDMIALFKTAFEAEGVHEPFREKVDRAVSEPEDRTVSRVSRVPGKPS